MAVTPRDAVADGAPITIPSSESPRVSVIIPSSAGDRFLFACLRSLARSAPASIPFETIVVLNESTAESRSLLDYVHGVRLETSAVNLGLAGAGNRGRWLARGELLIVLHDDAEIEPGWMEALVAAADAHPEAGAIGGKVLNMDGSLQHAGMLLWRDGSTSPPWDDEAPSPTAFEEMRAVDFCGTSSLLVRASTWDAVGGLDERFYPVYYVDVDLSMAIREVGQVVLYAPASSIRHHRGASASLRRRLFFSARNRARLLEKWGPQLEANHVPRRAGIASAIARAESFHVAVQRNPAPVVEAAPRELDRAAHDRLHLELAVMTESALARHLEGRLDEVERVRWWQLFRRARSFAGSLRWVRRIARRLRRRG